MIYPIYTIKDKLVGYGQPYTKYNEEVAKRDFKNAMTNQPIKEDLELYYLGTYNEESAEINITPEPKLIMKGDSINEI